MSQEIVMVGMNLTKNVFQVNAIDVAGSPLFAGSFAEPRCRSSSPSCSYALSVWRLLHRTTNGGGRLVRLAIRCG